MAEGRVVETMNNFDFELPETIIQLIQSFLTGKEAAQTIALSKSWHKAWLTRPNLHFDEFDYFPERDYNEKSAEEFISLAKKTIQRYEDSNLKIESFRLFLQYHHRSHNKNYELANTLIVKALKLSASHLSFELERFYPCIFVPREVFESENLVGLSLKLCGIDKGMDHNVRCHKLESLRLSSMEIENHDVIPNIISSCPLIQNLSLSSLYGKEGHKMVRINLPKMHSLKCLKLHNLKLHSLFFDDFSAKLPALKILTLDGIYREKEGSEIQISSHSLERFILTPSYRYSMFKIDVPSIKKLVIKACPVIPLVSFKSTSKEWEESHVSISLEHDHPLNNAWFLELNKLLTALSPSSNINISISGGCDKCFDYMIRDIQVLHKHRVENLNLDIEFLKSLNCYALFDGLFRFCRPKFITHQYQYRDLSSRRSRTNIDDFISKLLEQGTKGVFPSPENLMYGLNDLKEVYVQIFYDDDDVEDLLWKPLIEVYEASSEIRLEPKQKIRFQLVWKS